jgi:Flp pilus assembly protein TadD
MGDFGQAIRDYAKAVELKPNYAEAYHNRAIAHFHLKEYDNAWADVKKCRQLGGTPNPGLLKSLTEATGRTE